MHRMHRNIFFVCEINGLILILNETYIDQVHETNKRFTHIDAKICSC